MTHNGSSHTLGHFDPATIRLDQSYVEGTAVQKLLTTVHVGRPSNQVFFRTHPDESYFVPVMGLLQDKDEGAVLRRAERHAGRAGRRVRDVLDLHRDDPTEGCAARPGEAARRHRASTIRGTALSATGSSRRSRVGCA